MNYKWLTAFVVIALLACSEKDAESEYSDWESRNEAFIDSISRVAHANADGNWTICKAYTLGDTTPMYNGQNERFIYVRKTERGSGTMHPLFTDSVRVHYHGRLIPSRTYPEGYTFDKSYVGDRLNELTDVPALLGVGGNVIGFATALQYMVEGDSWTVYMPSQLGYGRNGNGKIPACSALIFDIKLAKIYRRGTYDNTDWY